MTRAGPDGCLYPNEMFELEEGEMVAFVPVTGHAAGSGRVQAVELPAVELAIMVHEGTYDELDRTYGALGTYVAERASVWKAPSGSSTWSARSTSRTPLACVPSWVAGVPGRLNGAVFPADRPAFCDLPDAP